MCIKIKKAYQGILLCVGQWSITYLPILLAVYSCNRYLLSTYYGPSTILSSRNTARKKAENTPLIELKFSLGEKGNKKKKKYQVVVSIRLKVKKRCCARAWLGSSFRLGGVWEGDTDMDNRGPVRGRWGVGSIAPSRGSSWCEGPGQAEAWPVWGNWGSAAGTEWWEGEEYKRGGQCQPDPPAGPVQVRAGACSEYNGETWEGLHPGKPGSLASYLPALTASFSSLPSPSLISKLFLGSSCLPFDYKSSL